MKFSEKKIFLDIEKMMVERGYKRHARMIWDKMNGIAPSREHSRKPNVAYYQIERMYPNERKLDVFSREKKRVGSIRGSGRLKKYVLFKSYRGCVLLFLNPFLFQ